MLRIVGISMMLVFAQLAAAQVKVDAKATGKHAKAFNTAKQTKQSAKQRKEQARRLQQQVKAKELYAARFDSLKAIQMDSAQMFSKEDSLKAAETILQSSDFPPEYRELILNPISPLPALETTNADSLALVEATKVLESEARKFLPQDLGATEDPLSQLTNPAAVGGIPTKPNKPNPNLVKPDQARKLFKKIDPEQFQEAQADIQKLKKTYSQVPDTRYPEEGSKRNSLENIPFAKRVYFGGNLSLQSTDPVIINTNLQVGYWINKKWLSGVGISLREQFANDSTSNLTGDGYGYSLFTRYDIPKGFFAWGEVERQINKSFFTSENPRDTKWQSAYMLGIGREFKIGIVQMMSMVLYDFNYQNNDLNARPLVFKIGFRFSKKPG
ncbi:hypothetical protein [Ekhidna sp. To15]|uniref:hypothetical protein n=1 Tax=Ekhidna sp. To15 TaxID=3395267 RepID=UPI003F5276C4